MHTRRREAHTIMNKLRALWRDRRGTILGLAVILGVCLLRFALELPCPIAYLVGVSCPGCGMTRGLWSLVTLDLPAAWHFHPAAFALPPTCILWAVCRLKGWNKAANATLIAFAILLILIYLWRIATDGGGVLVLDPRNGLIGRMLSDIHTIIQRSFS